MQGAHAFCACAHGLWTPCTKKLIEWGNISINALELVAAVAAVTLIEKTGSFPREKNFAMKCDNDISCAAANYVSADSAAMREALRIY